MTEVLKTCPICHSGDFSDYLSVEDHFLTGEKFRIQQCVECSFKLINPRPAFKDIQRYYRSEKYISHNAQKSDLISIVYRLARKYNLARKIELLRKHGEVKTLLDIGCGTGEFILQAAKSGISCMGVEPTQAARDFARNENRLDVFESLDALSSERRSFDCITMWHVIEHVHDLDTLFANVNAWLTPTGQFIVAVPNCRSWDAEYYMEFWAAWDVPRHLYHFEEKTLIKLGKKYGFQCRAVIPQKLDSFYVSMLSEKYRRSNLRIPKAIINGIRSNMAANISKRGYSSQIFILTR